MSVPKLPALRLTAEGKGCVVEDGVSLDLASNNHNKFSISYATSRGSQDSTSSVSGVLLPNGQGDHGLNSQTNDDDHVGPEDGGDRLQDMLGNDDGGILSPPNFSMNPIPERPALQISRSLSEPFPSQLSQLQNPYRLSPVNSPHLSPRSPQVNEVSVELADSIQLVIQTMLQISPPQVLDSAKEHFSACALSVPTTSMSAMFTAMKNINYLSANMSTFCDDASPEEEALARNFDTNLHNEFDIGETLQCLGDALSGAVAQAGVDLVIYHGDVGIRHIYVSGDEGAISFALSHIIRQVLNTAERGDSIELGLLISPASGSSNSPQSQTDEVVTPTVYRNGRVHVTIRISHRFAPSESGQGVDGTKDSVINVFRSKPTFSTFLFRRILRQIGGTLKSDLPPPESFSNGRTCDVEFTLQRMDAPPVSSAGVSGPNQPLEPTLGQLSFFGETLKGKRVTLYANAKGSFAYHLISYLTAWGMDVTHVSPDGQVDGSTDQSSGSITQSTTTVNDSSPTSNSTKPEPRSGASELIFIDDDVTILKERLQALRSETQPPLSIHNPKKRPSLSANHRPRSSQQLNRSLNIPRLPTAVVILHFTSLCNYKLVKDVVQSTMASYTAMAIPLPEIMIIPKPAGPRRFLIALHTAITKPTVDPFFIPIATSPMSPGGILQQNGSTSTITSPIGENVVNQSSVPGSQGNGASVTPLQTQPSHGKIATRPIGSRTNSDRSIKSFEGPAGSNSGLPPSPLALSDNVEYFSEAAQKLGNSPSSGLVIQSPDGQTAGIYFHPKSKNSSRNVSSINLERDKGRPGASISRRPSTSRVVSSADTMTFASLYETPQKVDFSPSLSVLAPDVVAVNTQASPIAGPASTASSPSTIVTQPTDDQQPMKSSTPSPSSGQSHSRIPSDESRTILPNPVPTLDEGLVTSSNRRSTPKKASGTENKDTPSPLSAKQKGKMFATGDANVVPPISVLIVDDNPINQTILSTFMKRKKIKYDLASNGQEAVQKWRTGGFHLILMDIQMPIMDGIQATKEIRRLEKLNADSGFPPMTPSSEGQTPSENSAASSSTGSSETKNSPYRSSVIIVALTASSLQSDRVAALAAGCNDFLTKPVSLLWLNNKIIEWGSIKALQMWADLRPEAVRSMTNGQAQQARNVADRLHVPPKGRVTPIPTMRTTSAMDENAAVLALASSAGPIPNLSGSSGMNLTPSPTAFTSATVDYVDVSSSGRDYSQEIKSPVIAKFAHQLIDEKSRAKSPNALQGQPGDFILRLNSRPTTPGGSMSVSDKMPSSNILESVQTRENGFTTVSVNRPPP